MATTVAVLGGGVAGLSAAHELVERGFKVTVYEKRSVPGGKARSYPVPGSATDGRAGLPAEHGFRFFPGFYRHLPDTMSRIPAGAGSAFDRLRGTDRILFAQAGGEQELLSPAHFPATLSDIEVLARFAYESAETLGIPVDDVAFLVDRLLALLTSCDARRYEQWDARSWWDFVEADKRSAAFQRILADGLTRTLVAARAREISARTGGLILVQLLFDLSRPGTAADRVLDAPTSDAWLTPWAGHLRGAGVELRLGEPVEGINVRNGRVAGVTVAGGREVIADHYVAALPVEVMRTLLSPELRAAEPRLNGLDRLATRWMNGILFYLREDLPLDRGHAIYVDSEWALTSISQRQFWRGVDFGKLGDGTVGGILSIDISEWQRPGRRTGKVAALCTRAEIHDEVWGQLQDHLGSQLDGVDVRAWFLDEDIEFPNPSGATNAEPLLINTAGSWADRPDAATRIPNLFLAADYVRTYTDLATMEGANEAARRAVNAILDATRSSRRRCDVWRLYEPPALAPARALDKLLYRLGRPPKAPVKLTPDGKLQTNGVTGRALNALGRITPRA
jgi:uncharacterized protein with NAD-binding domain and iron-sulfur cluster